MTLKSPTLDWSWDISSVRLRKRASTASTLEVPA
ncbi:hypothetical protein Tco_0714730, partial [Tanacetum coccineum]